MLYLFFISSEFQALLPTHPPLPRNLDDQVQDVENGTDGEEREEEEDHLVDEDDGHSHLLLLESLAVGFPRHRREEVLEVVYRLNGRELELQPGNDECWEGTL